MRTSRFIAVAVLGLASFASVSAQETYAIKFKTYADEGMTVKVRDSDKETGTTKFLDADGKVVNEIKPKNSEVAYAETILKRGTDGGRAAKYVRVYEKARETQDGKVKTFSYEGRTVVFERIGDAYRVGVVGVPALASEDLEKLLEKANEGPDNGRDADKAMTPMKPVALGQTWKVDLKTLVALLKIYEVDLKLSHGEAKLAKVFQRGTSQIGVVELTLKLAIVEFAKVIKFPQPVTVEFRASFERAIDGSNSARRETVTGKMKGIGAFEEGGAKFQAVFDGEFSGLQESSQAIDDPKARKVPAIEFIGVEGAWVDHKSKEGGYSASFPATPKVTKDKDAKNGSETFTAAVSRSNGAISYTVVYFDSQKEDPAKLLKGFRAQFAKDTKKIADVKLNGYDGIELVLGFKNDAGTDVHMILLIYATEDRVYEVMATSTALAKDKLEARKFLDSFKLTKKAEPKKDDK